MSKLALKLINKEKKERTGRLDLGGCGLTELPEELFELTWLEVLILSEGYEDSQEGYIAKLADEENFNRIEKIPIGIKNLQSLKEFHGGSMHVTDSEGDIWSYRHKKARLKNINNLKYLKRLEVLDVRINLIESIDSLRDLKNLKIVNLSNNRVRDINLLNNKEELTELSLGNNSIQDFSFLLNFKKLTYLDISNNNIVDVSWLSNLRGLTHLYLYENNIIDISCLSNLTKLKYLGIGNNNIADISCLSNLKHLLHLYLYRNEIIEIDALSNLKNLILLNLSKNKIKNIDSLLKLQNITRLDITSNQIVDISSILPLVKKGIAIQNENKKWDRKSQYLQLWDNPLTNPPIEIVNKGNLAVVNYFEEIKRQGSVPIYESKLLIIGEGGSGKTSLARRLINEKALMPKEKESTKGIDIFHYDFKTAEGKDFRINIWDFGGQEIYHSTHQFFLTKRSLYILLDDTKKDDKDVNDTTFNYWLQVVELLSESSPVLIIQNEKADRSKALDLQSMQGRFKNVKGSWPTNIETCRGLKEIRTALEYHVQELPLVGELLPKQWVVIRKALEELALEKDYITLEEYYQICADHKIPEEDRALNLSSYLHDLGTFLHFQQDLVLADLFILRNTWATDAVYKVLDNEAIKRNYGHFTTKDLTKIWGDSRYKNKRPQLLALMEKFQLCFQLKDKVENTWLAPQLLPIQAPTYRWEVTENLVLRYRYAFMPKGLLSRFFVRMNRYVLNPQKAWRSGVFLHREHTDAFVLETYGSREIIIRVKGAYSKELMTLISEEFDKMNENYGEKLRVEKLIPCNCDQCKALENPHFYDYENLKKRKAVGKQTSECQKSFEDVSVIGLLTGVFTEVIKDERDYDIASKPNLKIIELFLASSYELEKDRRAIEVWVGRENKLLIEKGIFLRLNIWEDFLDSMNPIRKQDDYNRAVLKSDIFISLFGTKAGKYTKEEFNIAYGNFIKSSKPKYLYTFFKNIKVSTADVDLKALNELKQFERYLNDLEHFPNRFDTTDDLILQLKSQLDKIL